MKKHEAEELLRMAARDGSFLVRQSSLANTLTVSFMYVSVPRMGVAHSL